MCSSVIDNDIMPPWPLVCLVTDYLLAVKFNVEIMLSLIRSLVSSVL